MGTACPLQSKIYLSIVTTSVQPTVMILAKEMMADLGQDYVNTNRLVIGFKCKPNLDI